MRLLISINSKASGSAGRKILSAVILSFILLSFITTNLFSQGRDTTTSSTSLRYSVKEDNYPFSSSGQLSPITLHKPSNISQTIIYDPETRQYEFSEKVGQLNYRPPSSMSYKEYNKYAAKKSEQDYWIEKSSESSGTGPAFMKNLRIGSEAMNKIFGTDVINITPQGSAELIFGYTINKNNNPTLPVKSQKTGSFNFKEKIMMNVTGAIGDKMQVGLSYNTEATFEFENKTKLAYTGKEDEIIKKIEAGDITFTLPGTLITGSQSLFGIKTEMQFGRLTVTSVISRQQGQSTSINVQGGAQQTNFEIDAADYDVNRHFFLSHFFRDNYNEWLKDLPYIRSELQIESIEVWVVNKQSNYTGARNIIALEDLGEGYGPDPDPKVFPPNFNDEFTNLLRPSRVKNSPASNSLNELYDRISSYTGIRSYNGVDAVVQNFNKDFTQGRDYNVVGNARPLEINKEFTVNNDLGYISLTSPLQNDQVLAVAYSYKYKGKLYVVGELSESQAAPKNLIVKLLKGTTPSPKFKSWDLMMKNVYSIDAYQVSRDGFVLNVLYRNDQSGVPVNYISEKDTSSISSSVNEKILLKVMGLDNLDSKNEPNPDGIFDFIEGVTINSKNGRIYFPVLEPFGLDLRKKITDNNPNGHDAKNHTADKYVFQELYDSTQTKAKQDAEMDKFLLKGKYQSSSSSDIPLNSTNVPKGSVKVTAGGMLLTEGADYTVDYTLGRVKILNQGLLESGTPIKISLESNSNFNMQTKTLIGTHLDYKFSENFNIGATYEHLSEQPLTQKVNMGEEPISNTMWGFNTSYRTSSQLLTTLVDKIPFINTKAPSAISFDAEFADLVPGESKTIGKNGIAYIDDFDAAQTNIDVKSYVNWSLGSAPMGSWSLNNAMTTDSMGLASGYGRAKLSWYTIDPIFYSTQPPSGIHDADINKDYVRRIDEKEIFPDKDEAIPGESFIPVLEVAYYPSERGPYNYDTKLNPDGTLPEPGERWGSMMRPITNTDFESSNIEYIEFWLMDPNLDDENIGDSAGDIYFHLGEISEDVLRDGKNSFENGLPADPTDTSQIDISPFGHVPRYQALSSDFLADPTARKNQDVGLDGLSDDAEKSFFKSYLNAISKISPSLNSEFSKDPSADDFKYFLDTNTNDILVRYKNFQGLEGNSPASSQTGGKSAASKAKPDMEDINGDNTINSNETYFQYHVSLRPSDLTTIGKNSIVDIRDAGMKNGKDVKWFQFRIPIDAPDKTIGEIEDFKSIRFMRMVLDGFKKETHLRFASLDLVRGDWRPYTADLNETAPSITVPNQNTSFEVSAVNIEENASKTPIPYVLPPGIDRAIDPSQTQLQQLNEQSMLLKVIDLDDGDARAVFKNVQLDLRQYKRLKMFIHAEELPGDNTLKDYDVDAFIRMGSDYQDNYYEYEVPLTLTVLSSDKNANIRSEVWPDSNMVDLALDDLVNLKEERNNAMKNDPKVSSQSVYIKYAGMKILKVKGNPNIAGIRQIMLGIRNPDDGLSLGRKNDGHSKSAEVWFDELRVTDFNDRGGWAATGRLQAQLADFGVINVSGSTSQPGFGSIEQTVEQRSYDQTNQYSVSSNLQLGKFFPEKSNVSIPLYMGASKTIINPEYFPADPDIKFKDILNQATSKSERDSLKKIAQDVTSRTSINLTNVRWNKQFKKMKILSPGNFSASVTYSYMGSHNYTTQYNNIRKYGADFNYVFSTRPKTFQPFNKSKHLKKPVYRIIRDLNFNPYPSKFAFTASLIRNYQEMKMRNISSDIIMKIDSTISKDFRYNRNYDLRWDLTRALKLDYTASSSALIIEPNGAYDLFENNTQAEKDSVWKYLRNGGQRMNFNQNMNVSYTLPLKSIPIFNWTNIDVSYGSTYSWIRGQQPLDNTILPLGNTVKNSNTMKLNASFNLRTLYGKVAFLKKLDSESPKNKAKEEKKRFKTVEYTKQTFFKKDVPKVIIHKLKTEDVQVKVIGSDGKEIEVKTTVISDTKISVTANDDITGATITVTGKVPLGKNPLVVIGESAVRLLIGFKNANVTWSRTSGTLMPGYLPEAKVFGLDNSSQYKNAPGLPFSFGWQDWNIPYHAIQNGWLTEESTFNSPFEFTKTDNFSYKTTYEPFTGFRIDLMGMRNYSEYNSQLYFPNAYDSIGNSTYYYYNKNLNTTTSYVVDNRYKGGNFSISIISISTAFEKVSKSNNWKSASFERMKADRNEISARQYNNLVESNPYYTYSLSQPVSNGYSPGFGPTSQDVLVPAFLAAYTNTNPNNVKLSNFFWTVLPNWRISWDGLSKVDFLQKYFKSITLTHAYKSIYSLSSFSTNPDYYSGSFNDPYFNDPNGSHGMPIDAQGNLITKYLYGSVSINEQFSPLIGINLTWNNDLLTNFEYGKSRMVDLILKSDQVNETRDNSFTIGTGYRFKEVPFSFTAGGNKKQIKSDLNVKIDFSVKNDITILRSLPESQSDDRLDWVSAGSRKYVFSFTADYAISKKLNLQLYWDWNSNDPYTSNTYLNSETNIGFSLRLTL